MTKPTAPGSPDESPETSGSPGEWTFMIDPAWAPPNEGDEPPFEAVVGGWFIREDGTASLFRPNPSYVPSQPGLPTDPVDAVLQLLTSDQRDGDERDGDERDGDERDGDERKVAKRDGNDLLAALADVLLGVAVDEQGMAMVVPAPDDVPSVLVATAPAHRARVNAPAWREVVVAELAAALPPEGVDVLINPGAPASVRLTADAVRDSVANPPFVSESPSIESTEGSTPD